jgi:NAD(P)-dependent dehydrogenase (short-subunit alcohol dehydrogenase family)
MKETVSIVTGAGAGIGRAIAIRLANEGSAIVVADIDETGGRETVGMIEATGGRAVFIQVDVAKAADAHAMVFQATEHFGGLNILVNNVGIAPEPYFPDAQFDHWGRTLDVNLRGNMFAIQAAIPHMRANAGGVIVNISSMAGLWFRPYLAVEYAVSKAGIIALTTSLGFLIKEGIRVNCICPGWVETEAVKRSLSGLTEEEKANMEVPPPPTLIQPEQIAEAVMTFVQNDTLAGRVMVWPDGENWHLLRVGLKGWRLL